MNIELLRAKEAIFKLVGQFLCPIKFDDGELYICNYCESALEAAFNILGIEENHIKLIDFCRMWEDNTRAIWTINLPNEPFSGITADIHYDIFKEDYERRNAWLDEIDEEDE